MQVAIEDFPLEDFAKDFHVFPQGYDEFGFTPMRVEERVEKLDKDTIM
jgi:hypothetical protein